MLTRPLGLRAKCCVLYEEFRILEKLRAAVVFALCSVIGASGGALLAESLKYLFLDTGHRSAHRVYAQVLSNACELVLALFAAAAAFFTWRRLAGHQRKKMFEAVLLTTITILVVGIVLVSFSLW